MIEDLKEFDGTFPGPSNLDNLGNVTGKGKNFVQHAGPISLPLYHITDRDANIVKALEFAQNEYRSFKSEFIRVSETLGFDGTSKAHVDKILQEIFKDKQ